MMSQRPLENSTSVPVIEEYSGTKGWNTLENKKYVSVQKGSIVISDTEGLRQGK